jgi:DNA-binding response OmpR family regulator
MAPTVVVVSRLNLVRQGISGRLALLGASVREYQETSAALRILHEVIPEIMVIDVEDAAWSWRPLLTELASTQRNVRVVLLARRMGIDEASEAKHLGVAGVILKPFREEEHMGRLFELLCEVQGARRRRANLRYYLEPESQPMLTMPGALSTLYRVVNVSRGGACVASSKEGLRELEDGKGEVAARLAIGGVHVAVACNVVYRAHELTGLRFVSTTSGRAELVEHLAALQGRIFGSKKVRGPW